MSSDFTMRSSHRRQRWANATSCVRSTYKRARYASHAGTPVERRCRGRTLTGGEHRDAEMLFLFERWWRWRRWWWRFDDGDGFRRLRRRRRERRRRAVDVRRVADVLNTLGPSRTCATAKSSAHAVSEQHNAKRIMCTTTHSSPNMPSENAQRLNEKRNRTRHTTALATLDATRRRHLRWPPAARSQRQEKSTSSPARRAGLARRSRSNGRSAATTWCSRRETSSSMRSRAWEQRARREDRRHRARAMRSDGESCDGPLRLDRRPREQRRASRCGRASARSPTSRCSNASCA